jgi:tetratricopeptide (TPR) repeat protein
VKLTTSRELYDVASLSLDLGHEDFGVLLLQHLLRQLPGHVAAHCLLGETHLSRQRCEEAERSFQYPLTVDPLRKSALVGMAGVDSLRAGSSQESYPARMLCDLYPRAVESRDLSASSCDESSSLILARVLTSVGRHEEAVPHYQAAHESALEGTEREAILELLLSQAFWKAGRLEEAKPLADHLISQRPMWIRPKLIRGDVALQERDDALGVALLHDAAALDTSCVVAQELLGGDGRYEWLVQRSLHLEAPSKAEVDEAPEVVRQLLSGDPFAVPSAGQVDAEGQPGVATELSQHMPKGKLAEVLRASSFRPEEGVSPAPSVEVNASPVGDEGVVPVRLIVSSRKRIVARYGEEGYSELDARLSELCEATARSTGDESIRVYVDDDPCLSEFGLTSVDASAADQITGLIAKLESKLAAEQRRIVSMLIVGGDMIVPFHRVANPADDEDPELLADLPYAPEEETSLLSRFSIGRLPDCEPANLSTLLALVERAVAHHDAAARRGAAVTSASRFNPFRRLRGAQQRRWSSIGYSAEIWAEASRAVFETIGDSRKLQVSPPLTDYDFLSAHDELPTLSYFNLHGFRGSPYWYGHGDSEYGSPLLPIALTPLAVSWTGVEGTVVYSEACYGADLEREYPDGSIALNFLAGGALGFVGCTAMSYGTLAPPLSGADLLGVHLWEGILGGLSIGDALRRAKSLFLRDIAEQQGYLDGEDQKALISFVLYGDPSLSIQGTLKSSGLESETEVVCPPLACCSRTMDAEGLPLPQEVREKVQKTLPFLREDGLLAHPLILCKVACSGHNCEGGSCSCGQDDARRVTELLQACQRQVVTKGGDELRHVVKVTINASGEVLKVLVSRGGTWLREGAGQR